ncbi:uncharacterized protein Tco025E_01777 [Trypanosoma conorhini]|uniref:Uncharacterized protein n=1 Tax=Trypanosoma conorhini TaxID=83891 RepID=A0A422Q7Q6_9TRYP|nr:uncharacterized protein Tco025E_01777 [Trypanosoma conorhini]RNF25990.1 hypothetical protein Tco025E_01777 [Trypanosoma conorhini]
MTCVAVAVLALSLLCFTLTGAAALPLLQYPFARWRLMNCRPSAVDWDECHPESYKTTVFVFAIPGFFVGGVVALTVFLYLIGKYVFDCCGGRKQSPRPCFPLRGHAAKYSREDLIRPVLWAVGVFCVCVVACAWGCTSQHRLLSQLRELHTMPQLAIQHVESLNSEFLEKMNITLYNASGDVTYSLSLLSLNPGEDLRAAICKRPEALANMLNLTVVSLFDAIARFSWAPYVLFCVTLGVAFVGMLFALCHCRRYASMSVFFTMALLAVVAWGFNGLYSASSFLVEESCFELTEFTERRTNVLTAVTKCNNTVFDARSAAFEDIFLQLSRRICEELQPYCYDENEAPAMNLAQKKVFACPARMVCKEVIGAEVMSWARTALFTATQITASSPDMAAAQREGYTCVPSPATNCDLQACSATCSKEGALSEVGRVAKRALYAINGLAEARFAFDTLNSQLSSCTAILEGVAPSFQPFCKGAADATYNLMQSTGLLGVTLIFSLYTYAIGAKRFIPCSEALLPQRD